MERALRAQLAPHVVEARKFLNGLAEHERALADRMIGTDLPSKHWSLAVSGARLVHAARLYEWQSSPAASAEALRAILANPITRNVRTMLDERVPPHEEDSRTETVERSPSWLAPCVTCWTSCLRRNPPRRSGGSRRRTTCCRSHTSEGRFSAAWHDGCSARARPW